MTESRKHILLTTDFSEESFAAFGPVLELARSLPAKITLLYVLPAVGHHPHGAPFKSPVPVPTDAEHLARAREDLEALRGRFQGIELEVDAALAEDEIAERICERAEQVGAGIIALASHGGGGLRRIVMGSVAEQVLRHAGVPVLVVPVPES